MNDEEYTALKKHTIVGSEMLDNALKKNPNSNYLRMAVDITRSHHEKFDGTGYPDGLKGEMIPLAARIVTVADEYDELVSSIDSKKVHGHGTAVSIIENGRGVHFDPQVVDVFHKCQEKFNEIFKRIKD